MDENKILKKEKKHTLAAERLPDEIILEELDFYKEKESVLKF